MWECHVYDSTESRYYMILDINKLTVLGVIFFLGRGHYRKQKTILKVYSTYGQIG